jgi:hypothetical protein
MSPSKRGCLRFTAAAALVVGSQLTPAIAVADPVPAPPPMPTPAANTDPNPQVLHNITYRARADGTSRGAIVAYKIDDNNVNSDQPTLLPTMTFEVNTVLHDPKNAGMEVSIQWPYGSNLHCEILVDDEIVAQADQFIAPRLFHPKDDPLYGTLQCGAPLEVPAPTAAPTEPAPPPPPAPTT